MHYYRFIRRNHQVRRLNRPPRREAGADALATARESREVVEADRAGQDDVRVVEECAV